MPDEPSGRYRTVVSSHGARYAWVATGESGGEDVPEHEYRARNLLPPFDDLPTRDEYEAVALAPGLAGTPGV